MGSSVLDTVDAYRDVHLYYINRVAVEQYSIYIGKQSIMSTVRFIVFLVHLVPARFVNVHTYDIPVDADSIRMQ